MTEQHNEPLLSPPAEGTMVNMGPSECDSTKKAFKVAGFTMLACLLIAGQGLTAYFLLNQKSQLSSLEDNTNMLQKQLNQRPSAPSAAKTMVMPMYNMAKLIDFSSDPKDPAPKGEPSTQSQCQQQASQAGPGQFIPHCDDQGNYLPMQCWPKMGSCWCVTKDGTSIAGSMTQGRASCGDARVLGRVAIMPAMPAMPAMLHDE
ncbi:hypothetical protein AAFF_G00312000 [Aldrovandia affinis]|uniref:Thyroglobulin type-1 domain-containing protein n=1 Tax=Aldrovandia affinis TaxID=143900 RepID=A0AAD7WQY8_9TELE|nr:hypothetical protein AAFF_G00312000 [Aldrovandia affinis]